MSVTEHERHELYTWFQENMGTERADMMMNLLPPVGWGDVATRRDLKHDIAELRAETQHEFAELRAEFRAELAEFETRIGTRLNDQLRTFGTWLFASQAAVIAALSVLFALT